MSSPPSRLKGILAHLLPGSLAPEPAHPDAEAIFHLTANGRVLRRTYCEFSDRARGLAYYLVKHGYRRVGILAPNTPAFLESIYAIPAAGGVMVPANYRLVPEDIAYIFDFAEVDCIIADKEYAPLLEPFAALIRMFTYLSIWTPINLQESSTDHMIRPYGRACNTMESMAKRAGRASRPNVALKTTC
ncbi:unnamed protein product [Parascedosporium putredinis]|uniref:AMP-dependent synthetase/ligase domain-containing protein n=1 Tax=Parascedosporium putredinis TaxID=1442378 RepID=A0A9P1GX27_9PEZI|nr:unnamed protein product [Parascedosporium putredinis]CAI7988634.1 unnamed protein product [Parascedosporium putredinis]